LGLKYLSEIAEVLSKSQDAKRYATQHTAAVKSFHHKYYDTSAKGYYPVQHAGKT